MKYIFSLIFVLSFPLGVQAQLEVFLNDSLREYYEDAWTGENYPDSNSDELFIEHHYVREDIPEVYELDENELRDRIFDILAFLPSDAARQERYLSFLDFDTQNMRKYISAALNENIDSDINEKESIFGLELTPYESVFQACAINLTDRENIIATLLGRIHNGDFSDIEDIEYSNQNFGDCIIPFPDARRSSAPNPSFPSNQLIFSSKSGNPLRFSDTLEQSASILLTPETASENLEETLKLDSERIETNSRFVKQHGKNRIHYVHQNHYVNPFLEMTIRNNVPNYSVGGDPFDTDHSLYISSSDEASQRMIQNWTEIEPGIYKKILLQENTYEVVAGVLTPRQNVGATSYYAILYNHDITPPICGSAVFSHDPGGLQRFVVSETSWMHEEKFVSFLCSDIESGCDCDISDLSCFERDGNIYSTPMALPHNGNISYSFTNRIGEISGACSLDTGELLQYDFINPDVRIFMTGSQLTGLQKEYVSNNGVLYNGVQISEKNYYNISDDFIFTADHTRDISFELFEPEITNFQQDFSGLKHYEIDVLVKQGLSWSTLGTYIPLSEIDQNLYNIDIDDLNAEIDSRDILTSAGEYALVFHLEDHAGNKTRATWQYTIIPGSIDTSTSTISTTLRNSQYANNTDTYDYTLTLRDLYGNVIPQKEVSSISHDCNANPLCFNLRTDMSGTTPSGNEALTISLSNNISDATGQIFLELSSLAPGQFTESFRVEFTHPSESVYIIGEENTFLAPVIGVLQTQLASGWADDTLLVGETADYRIQIQDVGSGGYSWNLTDFSTYLQGRHPDTNFVLESPLNSQTDGVYFSGTFESTLSPEEQHKTLLEIVNSQGNSGVVVYYTLGGESVSYRLSSRESGEQILSLGNTGELENPVRITGILQGVGNTHNLSERQNITDLDTYLLRNSLRKQVGMHIKNRQSNTTVDGIKYVDKTHDLSVEYILESDPDFETLVVRNGNIHIQNDFNVSGKKVGIISYLDAGYNQENGYNDIGNIYIEPEVSRVQAFIYADGALISTQSAQPISGDISQRNTQLTQQLHIFGNLFTRNTLAGARELAGEYMLPGSQLSSDQSLAAQYDLYYTRRGNQNCDQDAHGFCNIPEYLILEYDPRITSDPPKLFGQ